MCHTSDDRCAINVAIDVARLLLKFNISAQHIIGLGNAIYALERMPLVTDGACCEFGVQYRNDRESQYVGFIISESNFSISQGGSAYDPDFGSDSFSLPGWDIELDNNCNDEIYEIYNLKESVSEYLNLGAEIVVDDQSCINYDDDV